MCTKANRNLVSWDEILINVLRLQRKHHIKDLFARFWYMARFVTSNYFCETGNMIAILEKLRWESLKKYHTLVQGSKECCQRSNRWTYPSLQIRGCRNHHALTFQTPSARTDIYKGPFFSQTNREKTTLLNTIISSAERAEDGVARFTS